VKAGTGAKGRFQVFLWRQILFFPCCLVLFNPCFDQLLYERAGERLADRKANRCLTGFVTLKLEFMLLYDGRWDKKSNMVFERSEVDDCSVVFIIRHLVADALVSLRRRGLKNLAKLYKSGPYLCWGRCNVRAYIFWYFFHNSFFLTGGGGEIRTHEAFRPAGFQDRCNQPLCHPSG
jgi:hypothetical protein